MFHRYWVGQALSIVKVHEIAGSVEGTGGRVRYDVGDCQIAVQWFERDASGGDERRIFKVGLHSEHHPSVQHTFNSTELRLISRPSFASVGSAVHLEMRAIEPVGGVPLGIVQYKSRFSARLVHQARPNYRNVAYQMHAVQAEAPNQLWEISPASESAILVNCH